METKNTILLVKTAAMAKIGAAGAAIWDIDVIVTTCGMGWSDA